jgi:hypothetical protein
MRAGAKDLAHKLHRAGAIASPWLPAATHRIADGLLILTGAARRIAERQGENASLLVLRLKAQVKGDLDALRRAALAGTLTPPIWRKFAAVVSSGKDLAGGLARNGDSTKTKDPSEPEAQYATFRDRSSRNALICVEPWRCRLPVVQADNPRVRSRHEVDLMRGYTAVQRLSEASKSVSALPGAVHEGPEGGRLGPHDLQTYP